MARFTAELIGRIKAEVALVGLVESQGYALVRQGKDLAVCCPFHAEQTPSCVISPASNLFHCFGCGAGGSVIDWVMKTQGVSFRHAVELLKPAEVGGTSSLAAQAAQAAQSPQAVQGAEPAATAKPPVKRTTVPQLPALVSADADDQTLLAEVLAFYHQTLLAAPEALAYLEARGLRDAALINHFELGYANRTLGLRLPQSNRKAGAQLREQLQRIGLYRASGHEHFNGSLVIPVRDAQGVIGEVYGRKLRDDLREGTPAHTYLPGPHGGVFNYAGLVGAESVILCEALLDALTFWRWGFRAVTASFGVQGFTQEMLQALLDLPVKRVLIAYDRDAAGDKAALEVAARLMPQGVEVLRVVFPAGMDANQFALQMESPAEALERVIRQAQWLGQGQAATALALSPAIPPTIPALSPAIHAITAILPPIPASDAPLETRDNGLFITLGDRGYRIRGFEPSACQEHLKIQLYVQRGEAFFIDKLDLYSSKQRQIFINQACVELGVTDEVIKRDLGKVLLALEQVPLAGDAGVGVGGAGAGAAALSPAERDDALALLRDPNLPARILADFALAGVVGEETNKLVGYLAGVSRKLERPLAVVIQSSSAAGKSRLMDAVLGFMPEDERVQYSAMTGQSLFYMGETRLKHKILAISEEEGAHTASYALKLLQSEGEVTIASTGKDDTSGQLVTREYTVEGPVMLFLTTTAIDLDEELLNRCLVLTVNESREQTEAIHRAQRVKRTLQGLAAKQDNRRVLQLHRNAQRLLQSLAVINPYAEQLTFLADKTRTRRDHEKYLTLIDSIALLHQYQREIKTLPDQNLVNQTPAAKALAYIEVTPSDIALANRLAHEVLGKTLDELPPQTRQLLGLIHQLVQTACAAQALAQRDFRFSRKQVREFSGWGNTQLKIHCQRLEDMEYLLIHRGGRGQSLEYELLYQGEGVGGGAFVMGLLDVGKLRETAEPTPNYAYDPQRSGLEAVESVPSRPQVGGVSVLKIAENTEKNRAFMEKPAFCANGTYTAV